MEAVKQAALEHWLQGDAPWGPGGAAGAEPSGRGGPAAARSAVELEERAERAETALSALQDELGRLREAWSKERAETREALRVANAAIEESILCMGTGDHAKSYCDVDGILDQLPAAGAVATDALESIDFAEQQEDSELRKMERQIMALRAGLESSEERQADARRLLGAYEEAYQAAYEASLG